MQFYSDRFLTMYVLPWFIEYRWDEYSSIFQVPFVEAHWRNIRWFTDILRSFWQGRPLNNPCRSCYPLMHVRCIHRSQLDAIRPRRKWRSLAVLQLDKIIISPPINDTTFVNWRNKKTSRRSASFRRPAYQSCFPSVLLCSHPPLFGWCLINNL